MDLGLSGKGALVTGGAGGIGAAIALELAREGCDVAVVDLRDIGPGWPVIRGIESAGRRALALRGDVRDGAFADHAVAAAAAAFGRLDVLVCGAGITDDALSWRMTEAQWDAVIDVNLKGCFHFARAAGAWFKERRGGRIVTIASINGLRGKFGQANYAASKGGVIALSKTLARELGKFGVTVNVLAPGMVRTAMAAALPPETIVAARDEAVLGELASPEDCAAAVAFLCSNRAAHITGEVLKVDGGQYL